MKIKVHLVHEEGLHLEGDEPPSIMDFPEPLFRFEKPIHYQLDATWVGSRNLLIRGSLSTIIRARCVRTLEWFDLPVVVEDFQSHQTEFRGDEVDLTQEIREDILLALPLNPVLPETKPLKTEQPAPSKGGSEVWGVLNQLKLK